MKRVKWFSYSNMKIIITETGHLEKNDTNHTTFLEEIVGL